MTRFTIAAAVFVIALATYVITLSPTVGMTDSGELTLAATSLGVAHPPGFPLYVIVTHLFTRIPVGDVTTRANFASAFFAALAAAAMTFAAGDLVIAACLGLFLAFSRTLWSYATIAEVYALNTFLSVAMLVLALTWRRTRDIRYLRLAALAFGLALGVHYVTAGIVAIGAAILVGRVRARDVVPFILGGLLVYAYLPIAASRDPAMNWGNPTTLSRFVDHVAAKQYQQYVGGGGQIARPLSIAAHELPLVLIAGAIGLALLFRRDRRLFVALLAIIAANFAWVFVYPIVNDLDAYLLPSFIAIIVAAAAFPIRAVLPVIAIATLVLSFHDRSHETYARDYVRDALTNVPPDATIVTGDWQLVSPMMLLRPDVHVIQTGLLIRSWYLDQLERREHLDVRVLRPLVADWERGAPPSPELVRELNRFVLSLANSRHVYATGDVFATKQLHPALAELAKTHDFVPNGLTIEIAPGHRPRTVHRFMPIVTNPPPELAERYREAHLRSQ
jgi:hypothetical protein